MGPHTRTFGPSKSRRKRLLKPVVRLINARGRKGCILKAGLVFLVLLYSLYGLGYPWVGSLLQVWLGQCMPSANYSHSMQHFFQQIVHPIDVASHLQLQRTERPWDSFGHQSWFRCCGFHILLCPFCAFFDTPPLGWLTQMLWW
jgi:hypothetical protein